MEVSRLSLRKRVLNCVAVLPLLAALGACATTPTQTVAKGEVPIVLGPAVRQNITPMDGVLGCFADHVASTKRPPVVIGVGDIKDFTGKYSINEGNAITQGGSLMVYSALGKLSGAVRIAERFDPSIAERELAYTDRRQLGDGRVHELGGPTSTQQVPWLPYFGGTIQKSEYFIVGGITELNYNVNSGGGEVGVNQVSVKRRTYTQSVGIDLRIVDTKTLMVVKTVSLTKQFNGYEVGVNVFRFFDSDLFDINLGAKSQEPLQLGVRTALEEGTARLVSAVTNVDYRPCMNQYVGRVFPTPADELRHVDNPPTDFIGALVRWDQAMNAAETSSGHVPGGATQIAYDFGAADLSGAALGLLDQLAAAAKRGPVDVTLVARDTENFDPGKRDALINQRIAAITAALGSRGIAPGAVRLTWRPDPADTSIHRDGPGLQEIAKLRIGG